MLGRTMRAVFSAAISAISSGACAGVAAAMGYTPNAEAVSALVTKKTHVFEKRVLNVTLAPAAVNPVRLRGGLAS